MFRYSRAVLSVLGAAALLLTGCTAPGAPGESSTQAGEPAPSAAPRLSDPIDLNYAAELLTDDGRGRALLVDWEAGKVRAVDSAGADLWTKPIDIDPERSAAPSAYTYNELVIVDDQTGNLSALAWNDGSEAWTFSVSEAGAGCHYEWGFGSLATGPSSVLSRGDLILMEYFMAAKDENCAPREASAASDDGGNEGDPVVFAIDPATGEEAWPALTVGSDGLPFGGRSVRVAPQGDYGYFSWADSTDSLLTRIDLSTGNTATLPITDLRTIDDTGAEYYSVVPTAEAGSLIYEFGHEDPDDPMSVGFGRWALMTLPTTLPEEDPGELAPLSLLEHPDVADAMSMQNTFEPVCSAEPVYTPQGDSTCVMVQLFASTIKYVGSDLSTPAGWYSDAGGMRDFDSVGTHYSPQRAAVDGPDGPLIIVPGLESSIMALDAGSGERIWEAGEHPGENPWGGQGYLPAVGKVVVADGKKTTFYDAVTGEEQDSHPAEEFAALSSGTRFAVVSGSESSQMWSIVE
ncbi:hypothetical protein GCM10022261_19910 [Brevibacterium daeguense]|uniref:Pyrrolo-quinoline quinone repeat domain-containing protein n=1 Tax=Brevibacterium daeguense TaxID=909936 RepID=A0ABP8EKP8_9MICO|nr:PQQ-binding-like beta-propeller repeat protein [Brevibacterium daeguense]